MTERKKFPFEDPAIRQRAIAARKARPAGKGNTRYEDITLPEGWQHEETRTHDTRGRKIGQREREAQAVRAIHRLETIVDDAFDAMEAIVRGPSDQLDAEETAAWAAQVRARVPLLTKLLDKYAPDLRMDAQSTGRKVTQILIGGPLQGAMRHALQNGQAVAAQITEETGTDHDE